MARSVTFPTMAVGGVFLNISERFAGSPVSWWKLVIYPSDFYADLSIGSLIWLCATAYSPLLTVFGTVLLPVAPGPVAPVMFGVILTPFFELVNGKALSKDEIPLPCVICAGGLDGGVGPGPTASVVISDGIRITGISFVLGPGCSLGVRGPTSLAYRTAGLPTPITDAAGTELASS